jgi:hypothetical protein
VADDPADVVVRGAQVHEREDAGTGPRKPDRLVGSFDPPGELLARVFPAVSEEEGRGQAVVGVVFHREWQQVVQVGMRRSLDPHPVGHGGRERIEPTDRVNHERPKAKPRQRLLQLGVAGEDGDAVAEPACLGPSS